MNYADEIVDYSSVQCEKGNPIICTDSWNEGNIITSDNDFIIMYNGNKLFLLPQDKKSVAKKIEMPNVELLLDPENKVIGCIFNNFPDKRKRDLDECINRKK